MATGDGCISHRPAFFLKVISLVKALRVRADIVYVHYPSHSYVPLLLLGPLRSGRLAVHVHGSDVLREARVTRLYFALKRFVSSKSLKAADLIVVPSNYFKGIVTQAFKIPKERVFIFSSGGIDLNIFCKLQVVQSEGGFLLGYVGRLERDKGVVTLMKALAILRDRLPDMKTIIIGRV